MGPRMLQSDVLPGTSTARTMQGDGTSSAMTVTRPATPALHRFGRRRGFGTLAAVALVCAALGGCAGEQFQKGYILPPGALEQIPIGASQDQVLIVMGTPSTVATLNGEVFYYISQRSERKVAFMNQRVVDQRVIAIYFDKNRQVQRLANYGLQDGQDLRFHQPHHTDLRPGAQLPDAAVQAAEHLQLQSSVSGGLAERLTKQKPRGSRRGGSMRVR